MTAPFVIFPKRHAFLIGAQTYTDPGVRALKTPVQDIKLMADALTAYGYETHSYPDPTHDTFVRAIESIASLDPTVRPKLLFITPGMVWP